MNGIYHDVHGSKAQLRALHQFKIDELCREYRKIRSDWVRENKCACVASRIPEDVFDCKHIRKEIKKAYKPHEQFLWALTIELFNSEDNSEERGAR